jgi:hypothetical protein
MLASDREDSKRYLTIFILWGVESLYMTLFGEVGSMSTSMWEIEKFPHRNDTVFPSLL